MLRGNRQKFLWPYGCVRKRTKKGIGKALLLKSLESMQEFGYANAIIGWPIKSAIDFYKKIYRCNYD